MPKKIFLDLEIYTKNMPYLEDFNWELHDWYLTDNFKDSYEIAYHVTYWDGDDHLRENYTEMTILKLSPYRKGILGRKVVKVIQFSERANLKDARGFLEEYVLTENRKEAIRIKLKKEKEKREEILRKEAEKLDNILKHSKVINAIINKLK